MCSSKIPSAYGVFGCGHQHIHGLLEPPRGYCAGGGYWLVVEETGWDALAPACVPPTSQQCQQCHLRTLAHHAALLPLGGQCSTLQEASSGAPARVHASVGVGRAEGEGLVRFRGRGQLQGGSRQAGKQAGRRRRRQPAAGSRRLGAAPCEVVWHQARQQAPPSLGCGEETTLRAGTACWA